MVLRMLAITLFIAASAVSETRNYCGSSWTDANGRCQDSCATNFDCTNGEHCYDQCVSCKVNPTTPPSPPPAPTPTLQPYIMPGCPSEHPPGQISAKCAESIALVWHNSGGNTSTCQLAVSVALAESGGDAHVSGPNSDGSIDRGLWQINSRWHPEVSDACGYNPDCNGKEALRISRQGTDWSTWVTFQQGINTKFLTISAQGCAGYTPGPSPVSPTPSPGPSPVSPTPGPSPVSPTPSPAPSGKCHSLSPSVTDAWCNLNCFYTPPNCPASLCKCSR